MPSFLLSFFIGLGVFFIFLLASLLGWIPLTDRVAKLVVILSVIFWILGIPVSLFVAASIMLVGGPSSPGIITGGISLILSMLFVAFALYALTNIGHQYTLKNYRKVVLIALVPFIDIFIIAGLLFIPKYF